MLAREDPPQTFESLYLQHRGSVRRTLYWMVGAQMVDDLTQDVFVKVWRKRDGFRGDAGVGTWIHRITIRTAIDYLRSSRPLTLVAAVPAPGRDVPLGRTLEHSVAQLGPLHRSVFVLFYKEQLTEREIAEVLEIPLGTVKSRLHQARRDVKQTLIEQGVRVGSET